MKINMEINTYISYWDIPEYVCLETLIFLSGGFKSEVQQAGGNTRRH